MFVYVVPASVTVSVTGQTVVYVTSTSVVVDATPVGPGTDKVTTLVTTIVDVVIVVTIEVVPFPVYVLVTGHSVVVVYVVKVVVSTGVLEYQRGARSAAKTEAAKANKENEVFMMLERE